MHASLHFFTGINWFSDLWLSMTFSLIILSFPWPMLSSCSQSIYWVRHFPVLCMLVFIFFTGINWFSDLSVVFSTFDLFLLFMLRMFIAFSWLSMTHTSISGLKNEIIKWQSRFSMTCMNPEQGNINIYLKEDDQRLPLVENSLVLLCLVVDISYTLQKTNGFILSQIYFAVKLKHLHKLKFRY